MSRARLSDCDLHMSENVIANVRDILDECLALSKFIRHPDAQESVFKITEHALSIKVRVMDWRDARKETAEAVTTK
jgi:hypothetical protein